MIFISMIDEFSFPVRGIASGTEKRAACRGVYDVRKRAVVQLLLLLLCLGRKLISLSVSRYMVSDWLTKR